MSLASAAEAWVAEFHRGGRDTFAALYRDHFKTVEAAVGKILTGADKETVMRNVGRTLEEQLRNEAEATMSMFLRRDSHAIGARAFKEGRAPEWPHHGL